MKHNFHKLFSLVIVLCLVLSCFGGCTDNGTGSTTAPTNPTVGEFVDYVSQVKLDKSSNTLKQEVTVKTFVDGDTTHFHVPTSVQENGVLKARYLAINTPESTGKIEEWGKKASAFTKEKLSAATSIIIESDNDKWNVDSTGGRYLVWVWYKTDDMTDYRNLNLEILQNGLAVASNSAENRYGTFCMAAINQARAHKLYVFSGEPDPDYFYGTAIELDLKELRTNIDSYSGMNVAFTGVVSLNHGQSVYVEALDEESGLYYGMAVYYGYNFNGITVLKPGNLVRIVGSVQYYEAGGTWQVSGLTYDMMDTTNPNNVQLVSTGHAASFKPTTAEEFLGNVTLDTEEGSAVFPYAQLALNTSVELKNLYVKSVYTTKNPESNSYGAMTLTCEVDGYTIDIRTEVFRDAGGNLITEDQYRGKTIDVKGIVDYYDGGYQIAALAEKYITIHN